MKNGEWFSISINEKLLNFILSKWKVTFMDGQSTWIVFFVTIDSKAPKHMFESLCSDQWMSSLR